jgi:hypothetical protein
MKYVLVLAAKEICPVAIDYFSWKTTRNSRRW